MGTMQMNLESLLTQKHEKRYTKKGMYVYVYVYVYVYLKTKIKLATKIAAIIGGKQLIESGRMKAIPPKEAGIALKAEGLKLLDVRLEWEREKTCVPASLHVPLYIKDPDNSPLTLLKKWVHFGYIGLWTGQNFTAINSEFVTQVQDIAPDPNIMLLVACGEGLRSMVAVSKLHEAGYRNLGWLAGGFNRARDGDFPVEGDEKLQFATIGGVSYYFLKLLTLLQATDDTSS